MNNILLRFSQALGEVRLCAFLFGNVLIFLRKSDREKDGLSCGLLVGFKGLERLLSSNQIK